MSCKGHINQARGSGCQYLASTSPLFLFFADGHPKPPPLLQAAPDPKDRQLRPIPQAAFPKDLRQVILHCAFGQV